MEEASSEAASGHSLACFAETSVRVMVGKVENAPLFLAWQQIVENLQGRTYMPRNEPPLFFECQAAWLSASWPSAAAPQSCARLRCCDPLDRGPGSPRGPVHHAWMQSPGFAVF